MVKKKTMRFSFSVASIGFSVFALLSDCGCKTEQHDNNWANLARPRAYEEATKYASEQLPQGSKATYATYNPDLCQMEAGDNYKATLNADVIERSGKHTRMKYVVTVHATHFYGNGKTFFDWFTLDSAHKAQ